jgi:drug/metabolite transporter (DMT)-like permease
MVLVELSILKSKENSRRIKWGFIFAILTAITWGMWYTPGTLVWYIPPIVNMDASTMLGTLLAAIVITSFTALFVLLFLTFVWNGIQGKIAEVPRTFMRFKISKWFFLAAVLGGPIATIGSYLAIGLAGPFFASASLMLIPVPGAIVSWLWYKEKITKRMAIGMAIIIIGGILIYLPL